jgi:hypothetical protein
MDTLTRPQRFGYALSLLLLRAGWLLLLALILEWFAAHWSRPALAFQAAALVLGLLLRQRVPVRRLIVYPLILAGSIYLWDTTLPPPSLPEGWPRVLIPSLVLVGLLIDYIYTVQRMRHARRQVAPRQDHSIALDDAARLLGIPVANLRIRLQERRYVISIDSTGREYVSLDDVYALHHTNKPTWWQLYLWLLLMIGLSVVTMLVAIPAAWQTAVHIVWSLLTWAGMVVWVRANRVALHNRDRAKHLARARHTSSAPVDSARTLPLTPVQQHFLEVMERQAALAKISRQSAQGDPERD